MLDELYDWEDIDIPAVLENKTLVSDNDINKATALLSIQDFMDEGDLESAMEVGYRFVDNTDK